MSIKLMKIAFSAALGLAMTFTLSCSSGGSGGAPGDNGGGGGGGKGNDIANYRTVVIGNQTWMAENLNYAVDGSKCYDNKSANCDKYGRLYDWATAMALPSDCNSTTCVSQIGAKHKGICPDGWHIPSNADWDRLVRYVDGSSGTSSPYYSPTAGRYLKAASGWNEGGNGTDSYGFAALPGGAGDSGGNFGNVGYYGYWWSASEYSSLSAYYRGMFYGYEDVYHNVSYDENESFLCSVRCLQD
jgi:uncharacterized protein (TIGR02145 family)